MTYKTVFTTISNVRLKIQYNEDMIQVYTTDWLNSNSTDIFYLVSGNRVVMDAIYDAIHSGANENKERLWYLKRDRLVYTDRIKQTCTDIIDALKNPGETEQVLQDQKKVLYSLALSLTNDVADLDLILTAFIREVK